MEVGAAINAARFVPVALYSKELDKPVYFYLRNEPWTCIYQNPSLFFSLVLDLDFRVQFPFY